MGKAHVVARAREFAERAHEGQRLHDEAFILHLDEVALLVRGLGDLHQTVAYLQAVVSDSDTTLGAVEAEFGANVAQCVEALTDETGSSGRARDRIVYEKLRSIQPGDERAVSLVVALAARLVVVQHAYLTEERGRLRRYRREHRDFRDAVYRPGLADELWRELMALISA